MKKFVFYGIQIALAFLAFELISFFKLGALIGSKYACLSVFALLSPLAGAAGVASVGFGASVLRRATKVLFFGKRVMLPLKLYLPSMAGILYWSENNSFVRFYIPLVCIVLFNLHPIGFQACFYSGYWLIPLILYFIPHNSIFLTALGATFVQHAIGSVMWLYLVPMSAPQWLMLVPIVFVERLLAALCMTAVYYGVSFSAQYWRSSFNYSRNVLSSN